MIATVSQFLTKLLLQNCHFSFYTKRLQNCKALMDCTELALYKCYSLLLLQLKQAQAKNLRRMTCVVR